MLQPRPPALHPVFTDSFLPDAEGKGGITKADIVIGKEAKIEFLGATHVGE